MIKSINIRIIRTIHSVFLSLALVCLTTAVSYAEIDFYAAQWSEAGDFLHSIATADLDGDNISDAATVEYHDINVNVLKGNGDGTFSAPTKYSLATDPLIDYPTIVTIADLNNDTHPDLAVLTNGGDSRPEHVIILLNNGDGTFAAPVNYTVGALSHTIIIDDLNGDNILDITVGNSLDISVLIGNGDGTFAAAVNHDLGMDPDGIAIEDLNGDSRSDLVVCDWTSIIYNGQVWVLTGNGDGSFGSPVSYEVGRGPGKLAIADLNGDFHPDLAVMNGFSDSVSILMNNGDGSFAVPVNYSQPSGSIVIADLNGDSHPDLAFNDGYFDTIDVMSNNGDGTFQTSVKHSAGGNPSAITTADLDNDNNTDFVILTSGGVASLMGNGDGSFVTVSSFDVGDYPYSISSGDLNNDSYSDLVVANFYSNNVSVLMNNGDDTFAAAVNYNTKYGTCFVAIGDINGDKYQDLAVSNSSYNYISVLINNGDGTFTAGTNYSAGETPRSAVFADLDNDGHADLVVAESFSDNVLVFINNGDGTLAAAIYYNAGDAPYSVAVADLNNDSKLDVVSSNLSSDDVSVLFGNGDGTFSSAVNYPAGNYPQSIAIADLNNDSIPDLVVANYYDNEVSALMGNGDGTFAAPVHCGSGNNPSSVVVGNFDNDNFPDIAVTCSNRHYANDTGAVVSILPGNGDGTFDSAIKYITGATPFAITTADLNNDGLLDLAVANQESDNLSILLNRSFMDSDGDGVPDDIDGCPFDPFKIDPGVCGCGTSDMDSDGDGFPNCIDDCPNDPLKIVSGVCGCGTPETDTDGDGIPDCVDPVLLPPVADPGPNQEVGSETEVNLDGSDSYDPDGAIVAYLWEQTEGPVVELTDADSPNAQFFSPATGLEDVTLTFKLTVTDNDGLSSSETVIITVNKRFDAQCEVPPLSTSPADGAVDLSLTPVLVIDKDIDPVSCDTIHKTRWQISKDPDFHGLVCNRNVFSNPLSHQVPPGVLQSNTTYYWRANIHCSTGCTSEYSLTSSFTTGDAGNDVNGNGIPDDQEPTGQTDLNRDGQPDNPGTHFRSVRTVVGNRLIAIATSENITSLQSLDNQNQGNLAGMPENMPWGLINFRIETANPGDTVQVTIYFDKKAPADAVYYKYDPIDGWIDYSAHATFAPNRKSVTIEIQDGGFGDLDGVANAVIVDPGGIGNEDGDSHGGGSCFLNTISMVH